MGKNTSVNHGVGTVPVLEIGFVPPTADFVSIWSSAKERKFLHFQKTSKVHILYFDPPITESKYSYPIEYEYSIFVLFLFLEFCWSLKLFGPINILCDEVFWSSSFLVLPNVFDPPTTVAAVVEFQEPGATSALTISKCENFDPFFSMEYDSMVLKTHFILL